LFIIYGQFHFGSDVVRFNCFIAKANKFMNIRQMVQKMFPADRAEKHGIYRLKNLRNLREKGCGISSLIQPICFLQKAYQISCRIQFLSEEIIGIVVNDLSHKKDPVKIDFLLLRVV